nr:MAG TPA: hypothetical protein [Caudoviricetes sp.]
MFVILNFNPHIIILILLQSSYIPPQSILRPVYLKRIYYIN